MHQWATFYGEDARRTQLAFFDRHLREGDVAPLPPLRLEIRDRVDHVVQVRAEQEWPLARTDWRQLYLATDGELSVQPGPAGSVTFDLTRNAAAFTHAFDTDTEISGPMTVRLQVTTTGAKDPRLFLGVEKWSHGEPVPFEGSYGYGRDRVSQGRLRLTLRELDPERGRPHQPEHTFRTLQTIRDNEPMEILIPLSSSATWFHAGDSLRLLVAGRYLQPRNPLFGHFPHPLRTQHRRESHPLLVTGHPLHARNPRHPSVISTASHEWYEFSHWSWQVPQHPRTGRVEIVSDLSAGDDTIDMKHRGFGVRDEQQTARGTG